MGHGAFGIVNNLTKNFFAVLSFQSWRTLLSAFGLAFLNFGPFLGIWMAHGWERLPYAIALASMFSIYIGMSWRSSVPPYYFLLHPVSTTMFIYTFCVRWFSPCGMMESFGAAPSIRLEELRKGMV